MNEQFMVLAQGIRETLVGVQKTDEVVDVSDKNLS